MEFLHHGWIFDHENVRTEDDGHDDQDVMAWSEFQRRNKVRIQFLCIVLDSSLTEPDEYLKKTIINVREDIHQLVARDGEVFLAPIAVRSPGAHSSKGDDFRPDYKKICHPITTKLADEFQYCYHVTEMTNVNGIIKEGHRGGRAQVISSVPQPVCTMGRALQDRARWSIDPSWNCTHCPGFQRAQTHWTWMRHQI